MSPRSLSGWGNSVTWTGVTFDPLLPWAVLSVFGAVALAVGLLGYWGRARGTTLRLAAAAALLATLANPALVKERRVGFPDVAVVVVDETPSQDIGARRAQTEAALAAVEAQLAGQPDIELRVVRVRHETVAAAGDGTHLIEPLTRALQDVPRRRIAGAILITDGQVHDLPADAARAGLPGPIHALITGAPDEIDRRLVVVRAPSFGIVGKTVEMTVRIEDAAAPQGARTQMTLRRDGGDTDSMTLPIGIDFTMTLDVEHGGHTVWELGIEPGTRELTLDNNRAVVTVNGVRDRLRVLLVSGEPHAGQRTWRNLLKADPSVDLVHFTILRPPEKQDGTPIEELSLISFPTRELFEVKLREFDLVIFDRYRQRGVLPPAYLRNVVEYVHEGGALLEAGGPAFASPFSLYRTPLGAALPGEPTGALYERGFRPQVTPLGLRHPVTAGLTGGPRDPVEAAAANAPASSAEPHWGRWFRQVEVDALRGRTLMSGIENRPLLILDRVGKGRVAQLNSDHIWLWSRGVEGGGPQAELLRRLAHWLMKEPDLEEDDLRAEVREGRLEILRRSVDPYDRPVTVTGPGGASEEIRLTETHAGQYTASLPVSETGLYRVSDGDKTAMAAAGALNPVELADVRANRDAMQPLAEATGGSARWLADGTPSIRRVSPGRDAAGSSWIGLRANEDHVVTGIDRTPLLPALLVLLLALGATAWAWRREGR